jgi:type II secretory pathway pseudopilin PulG
MAVAGLTLSIVWVAIMFLAIPAALLLPALARARMEAQKMACKNNLRNFGLALEMYSTAKGRFPPDLDALYPDYVDGDILLAPVDTTGCVSVFSGRVAT